LPVVLLLAYLLPIPALFLGGGSRANRPWSPYLTVVTHQEPEVATQLLLAAGIEEVVSEATSEVLVTRFNRIDRVPQSEAVGQLDPQDPRLDPFITGLAGYFRLPDPDQRNVLYVLSAGSAWRTHRLVRQALGDESRVAEWTVARRVASVLVVAVMCIGVALAWRRDLVARVAGYLPWLPVAAAGLELAAPVGIVLLCWTWLLRVLLQRKPGSESQRAIEPDAWGPIAWMVLTTGGSLAFVVVFASARTVMQFAAAALSTAVVTVIARAVSRSRESRADHPLFAPLPIFPRRSHYLRRPVRSRRVLTAALAIAAWLLLAPALADRFSPQFSAPVPVPVPVPGAVGYDRDSLAAVWAADLPGSLPDVSDYLAHRAYQEGLSYGREYGFPEADERVTISRFAENEDGAYTRFTEEVLAFDDAWVRTALATAPRGIVQLLAGRAAPSGVVLSPEAGIYSGYPLLWQHVAYVILALLPAWLIGIRPIPGYEGRSRIVELAGRRRQVA
jgi:hypothetical protein